MKLSPDTSTKPSNLLATLLLVLFVGLKLAHVIAWSWWWVMSPLWIPLAVAGVIFAIAGIIAAIQS